jgi:hypothetical protein
MQVSTPVSDAIRRETNAMIVSLDRLKPLAVNRLYHEIINLKSPNAMRAIELAGRFKETDWFVRNSEVQLGVFVGIAEEKPNLNVEDMKSVKE